MDEVHELAAQGVKPWDEDPLAVLDVLCPGRRVSLKVSRHGMKMGPKSYVADDMLTGVV